MPHYRSLDDSTEDNLIWWDPDQEVSKGNNIPKWPRDCSCDTLTKNVAAFCPCPPKNLPEVNQRVVDYDLGRGYFKTA